MDRAHGAAPPASGRATGHIDVPGAGTGAGARRRPGRSCPLHYGYRPESIGAGTGLGDAPVLWVVGGLYGNRAALDALDALLHREAERPYVVFNGDFHWFDASVESFAEVDERVHRHVALRGNVETELASDENDAGCGCGYPEEVTDATVAWSNTIIARLEDVARSHPGRTTLGALPMHAWASVAGARVGLVHGDAWSLAGWDFAAERVDTAAGRVRVAEGFAQSGFDVIASSHTCLPVCRSIPVDGRERVLVNNGAAGMPNFAGARHGVVTRIATRASGWAESLYAARAGAAHVEAIALAYDNAAFTAEFDRTWPTGPSASRSYRQRIEQGPAYTLDQASPRGGTRPAVSRS